MNWWEKGGISVPATTWVPLLSLVLSIFVLLILKGTLIKKSDYKKTKFWIFWTLFFGFNFLIFLVYRLVNGPDIFGFGNLLVFLSLLFFIIFLTIYLNFKK